MNPYPFAPPPPAPRPAQSAARTHDTRDAYVGRGRGGFDNRRGRGGHRGGNNHNAFSQHNPSTQLPLIPNQYPIHGTGANGTAPSFPNNSSYPNGYGSWTPGSSMTGHAYPQYPQAQAQTQPYYNAYGQPATPNAAQGYQQQTFGHTAPYNPQYAQNTGMPYIPNQSASLIPNAAQFPTPAFIPQFSPPGQQANHNQHRAGQSNFNSRPKSFPNSFPGQKRKRENDQSPNPNFVVGKPGSSGPSQTPFNLKRNRNDRPKVQAPPSVPNFGFAGLPKKPDVSAFHSNRSRKDSKKTKKRKTNQLGLTPKADLHEDSDGDLEDEEAAFASSGLPPSIQFNGQSVSLTLPAEVKAWIADRKKNFPTRARIAQKKAAQEALVSRSQQDQSRPKTQQGHEAKPKAADSTSRQEKQRLKMEKHLEKANKLRLKLAKDNPLAASISQPSGDAKPDPSLKTEEGEAVLSEGTIKDGNSMLHGEVGAISDANSTSSSSDSSNDSDDGNDKSSGDEPPEALSIKKPLQHKQLPPESKPRKPTGSKIPCKYFLRDGNCRRRDCRFSHEVGHVDRKLTLFEQLTQKERHREHLKALDLIKSLGDSGFFG